MRLKNSPVTLLKTKIKQQKQTETNKKQQNQKAKKQKQKQPNKQTNKNTLNNLICMETQDKKCFSNTNFSSVLPCQTFEFHMYLTRSYH